MKLSFSMFKHIKKNPPIMILLTFLSAIFIGTLLLKLPISTHDEIGLLDALFTSTSAVCVTGLIVHDTSTYFTTFGQFVILFLIQMGGIGILTFFALIIGLTSGHLQVTERGWIEGSLTQQYRGYLYQFVKRVFIFVFSVEAIGTALLFFRFIQQFSWGKALFFSLFHSVSAFCNAGFSLFSNSLVDYRGEAYLNSVIMALIILGGIGFVVVEDIVQRLRKSKKTLAFHTHLVLYTSAVLLVVGAVGTMAIEYSQSFRNYSWLEKFIAAAFQSVTCRTAGFNTIELSQLSEATLFGFILLMAVGGSPGSTSGGVKTTSVALMTILIISRFRGRERPELFGRTVSKQTIERIIALFLAGFVLITVVILLLLVTEQGSPYWQTQKRPFLSTMFEVTSAFGTVGLTMGMTPFLTTIGKWLVILLMFIGRLGPLTFLLLMMAEKKGTAFEYPEEEVMIG